MKPDVERDARQSRTAPAPVPAAAHAEPYARWLGWRLRVLAASALVGCIGLALLARAVIETPHVEARWRATHTDGVALVSSRLPALERHAGDVLQRVEGASSATVAIDALALVPSARWLVDDESRQRHATLHAALAAAHADPPLTLVFAAGGAVTLEPAGRPAGSLAPAFWLAAGLALALYLLGMVVMLARPAEVTLLYAVMTTCQAGNLVLVALESAGVSDLPPWTGDWELALRTAFDLATVAAMVHAAVVHPLRLPHARAIAVVAWLAAVGLSTAIALHRVAGSWWWTQGAIAAGGVAAVLLFTRSHRREPNPAAVVLRRITLAALAIGSIFTLALGGADAGGMPSVEHVLAHLGAAAWTVFLASLLLLLPFLGRRRHVTREFAMLAAATTVATSLDLLLVTAFSLSRFASLTLSLFLTLAVYLGARQWVLSQLLGNSVLTAERMFARLYRAMRQVTGHAQEVPEAVVGMLRDLFDPLHADLITERSPRARVGMGGSLLVVPLPLPPDETPAAGSTTSGAVSLRYAGRGRRLFTDDDARLADRLIEQLTIALAYERAVERGRREERLRIAQDLHDDIGARLLTLMYQAPSPEIEDYLRRTLLDLKTLTRGLAAPPHSLGEAAAEWKADLGQRLTLAGATLRWRLQQDADPTLSVVQWSALTRVLRELTSNAIAHARAEQVDVSITLEGGTLEVVVTDDGMGGDPARWSHGLGLSGVRKRVKQLGGEVAWSEVEPRGIRCRVTVGRFLALAEGVAA